MDVYSWQVWCSNVKCISIRAREGGGYEWVPMTSMLGVTLIYNGLLKLPSRGEWKFLHSLELTLTGASDVSLVMYLYNMVNWYIYQSLPFTVH